MTAKTITQVVDTPREWDGQYGHNYTYSVTFADGEQGQITTNKAERVAELRDSLKALVGKPTEFELESGGNWPDGNPKPWRIKGYPGKPGQQDGQRPFGGGTSRPSGSRHDPETNASIEAQVAAKIAGEMAVAMLVNKKTGDALEFIIEAIPKITTAIRSAARGTAEAPEKSESGSRPPDGPSPTPDSDKAEGEGPGPSPSGPETVESIKDDLGWGTGPMTAKQKAKLNMLYGSAGAVMKAARTMFPDVTKLADVTEDQAAALIEDKG